MKVVGKYIVITPENEKITKTKKGLILDEANREDIRYRKAEVVEVGDEVNFIKSKNNIYYDRHAGFQIEIKEVFYKVIKESDVVIVL